MHFGYRARRLLMAAAALAGLCGCATITTGADQSITVVTDPDGAKCRLDRKGQSLAVVNPTPGTVQIDKSKDAITITCSKESFKHTVGSLGSEFQGMTFGNVIFGGIIGVAVDAGSGAMNEYPSEITIVLIPESFPTLAQRDAFFDAAVARSRARTAEGIRKARANCSNSDGCPGLVDLVQKSGDAEVLELESERVSAKVGS